MRDVVLYGTETMADWEYGYLIAGIAMAEEQVPGRYRVRVAGEGPDPVRTKGGLTVTPDTTVEDISVADVAMLVLPGADTWSDGHDAVLTCAGEVLAAGGTVAAICGATMGLARSGLLDTCDHTSNAPEFVDVDGYSGGEHYVDARVVTDQRVITAPATAPIDFARDAFAALELLPPATLEAWYGLFTTGERHFYDRLTGAA